MGPTRTPTPLWLPIAAAVLLAIAALVQQDTVSRVLLAVAAVAFAITAVLQWRMQRRKP